MTDEKKRGKILERLENYSPIDEYRDRQTRLKSLVKKHGEEMTALAAGLTVGSLKQYLRVTTPQSISENTVAKAENVLKGL